MHLENIKISCFKNYKWLDISFSPGVNGISGPNGTGKTNLLDAIYYLCMTKSAFNLSDQQSIKHGEDYFRLEGHFVHETENFKIECGFQKGRKKLFKVNAQHYDKISQHIGRFPVVLIEPYDTDIIRQSGSERRRFFDSVICQLDTEYLENLVHYNRILKQRNRILKDFAEKHYNDAALLETYDAQLIKFGNPVYARRKSFIEEFLPYFQQFYRFLSDEQEQMAISYESALSAASFRDVLYQNRQKDQYMQRSTAGLHTDDYAFNIDEYPVKKYGSQGQQKSFILSLKLAQFAITAEKTGIKPVLLLDDIFDKLDDRRIFKLLELITGNHFGQIFITDARPERSQAYFEQLKGYKQFIDLRENI